MYLQSGETAQDEFKFVTYHPGAAQPLRVAGFRILYSKASSFISSIRTVRSTFAAYSNVQFINLP